MNGQLIPPSFWDHVEELRKTLLYCLATILIATCVIFSCFDWFYPLLAGSVTPRNPIETTRVSKQIIRNRGAVSALIPINNAAIVAKSKGVELKEDTLYLPSGAFAEVETRAAPLVVLSPLEGMISAFKVSLWLSAAFSSPIWGYFILRFLLPGLKPKEKQWIAPFIFWSLAALAAGVFAAFWGVIPLTNGILSRFNDGLGTNMWSVKHYLDYAVMITLSTVTAAESAVVLYMLVHFGKIKAATLIKWRSPVFVILFVLSAVITPPDIITQIATALPMAAFYQGAVWYAWIKDLRENNLELSHAKLEDVP